MNKGIEKIKNELNNDDFLQALNDFVNDARKSVIKRITKK